MHLSPYDTTYRFGWLAGNIQEWRVDKEDWLRRGGVAEGSALVAFQGAARMLHQNKKGGRTLPVAAVEAEAKGEVGVGR